MYHVPDFNTIYNLQQYQDVLGELSRNQVLLLPSYQLSPDRIQIDLTGPALVKNVEVLPK